MHGTLTNDEQLKAFRSAPKGYRKVVFSTNVAETSVTISGIVHGISLILNFLVLSKVINYTMMYNSFFVCIQN